VMQRFEECQKAQAEKEESMQEMQKTYEEFKSVVAKVNTVDIEMKAQLDDYVRSIKDITKNAKNWEGKLQALREAAAQAVQDMAVEGDAAAEGAPAGEGELADLSEEELATLDAAELQGEVEELEGKIKGMNSNLNAIADYRTREREFQARVREFDEVSSKRDAQRTLYEQLRKQRLDDFMTGFKIIGMKLKEMYQMITLGGDAELELLDSLDPFSEGIVFSVRPPKKSWKNISNLSGGEKTLSSLALVFALHHYKPTPLYVMDEIDAALDFRNVSIVGHYIKERTRNAQFIIISLRNNMFELADRLVGIYKTQNSTKSVAIDPKAFTIPAH